VTTKARGWAAFCLGVWAVVWALALIVAAFAVPAYSGEGCEAVPGGVPSCGPLPSQTLFAVNGWWVVELLLAVALVTALALWALHVRCSRRSTGATTVATCCIVGLAAFSIMTGFSIGFFVLPVVLLLTGSAWLTPPAEARPDR
jgi:hypothetical protein